MFKESIITKADTLKVMGIGNAGAMLEKYLTLNEIAIFPHTPIESSFWNGTDIGIIVTSDIEENSWENFQKEIIIAREHNVITFPIFISEKYPDVTDNIIVLNPRHFLREVDIYNYIEDSIKSIQSFISQHGFIDENLEDLRSLFKGNGRVAFSYYDYKTNASRYQTSQNALQMKAIIGSPITDAKFLIWIISSSENNIRNMDLPDFIEEFRSKINNDCTFIWTAIIDKKLTDGFHIYSLYKF